MLPSVIAGRAGSWDSPLGFEPNGPAYASGGKSEAPASRRPAGQDCRPNRTAPPTLVLHIKQPRSWYLVGHIDRYIPRADFVANTSVDGLWSFGEGPRDPSQRRLCASPDDLSCNVETFWPTARASALAGACSSVSGRVADC